MVSEEEAAELAMALPEVTEGARFRQTTWFVGKKAIAWRRPFSKADLERFGDVPPPKGPILAVTVADLLEKDAAIASNPKAFFTIEHFNGYPAFLVQLDRVTKPILRAALVEAWLACAPPALAAEHRARLTRKRPKASRA